jgi:hypothetical protein
MALRRSRSHRKYRVRTELENFELGKVRSALTLQIFRRGKKLGELQLCRGSVYWWGARRQNKKKRITWPVIVAQQDVQTAIFAHETMP